MATTQQQLQGDGPGGGAPDLFSQFPPGVNPETFRMETVAELIRRAAYFPIFSMPNPEIRNVVIPVPGVPNTLAGIHVFESLHRFQFSQDPSSCEGRPQARNLLGQQVATVQIKWRVIPDNFQAAPDRVPPLTPLNPMRSQRFAMMDGEFKFLDKAGSGFHGFGVGRTFPVIRGGEPRLRIGAVVEILEGFGGLAGCKGNVVVNGYIQPPDGLALNMMLRVVDPDKNLLTQSSLDPIRAFPADSDPDAVFLAYLGEPDPERPTTLNQGPTGEITGSNVSENLRLVDIRYDLGRSEALRSTTSVGRIAARLNTTLVFNPMASTSGGPIPYYTKRGVFTFINSQGRKIGTICGDIVEGRAFKTNLQGAPAPVFRMGGFGPLHGGSGVFEGADGMLSLNAAVSVFPRTLTNLYVFRLYDPEGKFRATCHD